MAKSSKKPAGSSTEAVPSEAGEAEAAFPGPTRNAATNLLIADIALRAGMRLGRRALESTLLRRKFTPKQTKRIMEGRPLSNSFLSGLVARVATRSLPGAMLVGGGLLAKTLYERRKSVRDRKTAEQEDLSEPTEKG